VLVTIGTPTRQVASSPDGRQLLVGGRNPLTLHNWYRGSPPPRQLQATSRTSADLGKAGGVHFGRQYIVAAFSRLNDITIVVWTPAQ